MLLAFLTATLFLVVVLLLVVLGPMRGRSIKQCHGCTCQTQGTGTGTCENEDTQATATDEGSTQK